MSVSQTQSYSGLHWSSGLTRFGTDPISGQTGGDEMGHDSSCKLWPYSHTEN